MINLTNGYPFTWSEEKLILFSWRWRIFTCFWVPYFNTIGTLTYLTIVHDQILHFLLIYQHATILLQLQDIQMVSSMYCTIFVKTTNMSLFYSRNSKSQLLKYIDADHLSNPHKTQSQTRYVFSFSKIDISWRYVKQAIVVISSNHSNIFAIYEVSREYI